MIQRAASSLKRLSLPVVTGLGLATVAALALSGCNKSAATASAPGAASAAAAHPVKLAPAGGPASANTAAPGAGTASDATPHVDATIPADGVKGIHVTGWIAGGSKSLRNLVG